MELFERKSVSLGDAAKLKEVKIGAKGEGYLCLVEGDTIHLQQSTQLGSETSDSEDSYLSFLFNHEIDCVTWACDMLVAGDRSGQLHFISPQNKTVFSQALTSNDEMDDAVFFDLQFHKESELLILETSGNLTICGNFSPQTLQSAMTTNSEEDFLAEIHNTLRLSRLDLSDVHDGEVLSLLPLPSQQLFMSTGGGCKPVCVWQGQGTAKEYECLDYIGHFQGLLNKVTRSSLTSCGSYLITLSDSGVICVWLLSSLIMTNILAEPEVTVRDFVLFRRGECVAQSGSGRGNEEVDGLCVITEGEQGQVKLQLLSVPSLEVYYSLEISPASKLFHGDLTEDTLFYLDISSTSSAEVVWLVQALPENKLTSLLVQRKFTEAEAFALEYGLDPEIVLKSKAKYLNDQLSEHTTLTEETTQLIQSLTQCLDQIKDERFIADMVFKFSYQSLEVTTKMLVYLSKKAREPDLLRKVTSTLNKLTTYQIIDRNESARSYLPFLQSSPIELVQAYLRHGDIQSACCIHNRHMGSLVRDMDSSQLLSVIHSVPETVNSDLLGQFVRHCVLPFVLQRLPQSLGELLGWIIERIKLLETTEQESWPENGLHLTSRVLGCVSSFKNPSLIMPIQPHPLGITEPNGLSMRLSDLQALQNSLSDMQYLQTSLQCPVTLSEYESEPREVMVFRLLDKVVAAELVATTIGSKVTPYVQKHGLKLDVVLLKYTKLFLSQFPTSSNNMAGSPYESKAIALIQAIQDKELHLSGCLELLRHLQPPWSETVEELVQHCLALDHSLVSTLRRQYKLLQLKKLLHKYEIRNFNFSGTKQGMVYMRRILASNQITALQDALEVADMYQLEEYTVYREYIVNLTNKDKIEEASDILTSLSTHTRIAVAQQTLSLASCKLQLPFHPDIEDVVEREGTIKLALLSLRVLLKHSQDGDECVEVDWTTVQLYKRLLALQTEYSVFITPQELADKKKCAQLFAVKISEYTEQDTQQSSGASRNFYRFCSLIGYSEEEVKSALVLKLVETGQLDRARAMCSNMVEGSPDGDHTPLLLAVAEGVWHKMERDPYGVTKEEVEAGRTMASIASSSCTENFLIDAVEVYKLSSFLHYVHSQCTDSEILTESPTAAHKEVFSHWSWDQRYREEGLVLDQEALLPLAAKYASSRVPQEEEGGGAWGSVSPLQPRTNACEVVGEGDRSVTTLTGELREVLKDSGHTLLSLHCTANTLSMLNQRAPLAKKPLEQMIQEERSALTTILTSLTTKVLSSRRLDHDLSLSMLLTCPPTQAVPLLQGPRVRSMSSYSRVIALCKLCLDYSLITRAGAVRQEAATILKSAEWGKRLGQHKVAYTEAFRGGLEERRKVVGALLRCKELDLETIVKYCSEEAGQNPQSVLLTYLRVILTEWEENYEGRAAEVIKDISNTSHIVDMFSGLLQAKVSPYDYRRISFLLQFLAEQATPSSLKVSQGLLVLDCLRHYQRVCPPGEYETTCFQASKGLPEVSGTSLPFHRLLYGQPMKILAPEATVNTIEKLTTIARLLKLPMDDFYSTCIENMFRSHDCHVTPAPPPSFADVSPLLERIQDKAYAVKIAKWLVEKLREEQDKASALKLALSIATQCQKMAKTEAELKSAQDTVSILEMMLALSQTQCLLQEHRLDQPKYLDMWGPELIMQLYADIPVNSPPGKAIPPIHSVAAQVAQISKVSLDKIRNKLREQWLLSFSSKKQDMDLTQVSLLEDPTEDDGSGSDSEEKLNMKRLVYLLKFPDKLESNCRLLLNWARGTSSHASCMSRVRALQVLFAIATPDLIQDISGSTIEDLRDYMQSALFVCELEGLHINTSLRAFQSCKKEGLVRTLWRNHSHQPKGVRLIAELCLYYGIGDGELWSRALEKLYDLAMLPYLRYILKRLASSSQDLHVPGLAAIWQKTLTLPFETVSLPLGEFQREECDESLAMVHECPFPLELDIGCIIEHFNRLGLLTHALSCIPMLPWERDRDRYIKTVLNGLSVDKYSEFLTQVNTEMLGNKQVKETIYQHLDESGLHEVLLGSEHFADYVDFLVSGQRMNGLLLKTLQADRLQEAVQLVEMHYSKHGISSSAAGKELLRDYIQSQSAAFPAFIQQCITDV